MNQFASTSFGNSVANSAPATRAEFIRKTYLHLAGAILAFVGIELFLFNVEIAQGVTIAMAIAGALANSWFIVLALFMGVSFLANWWAHSSDNKALHYLGLGLFIVAEAIVFVPMLYIAAAQGGPNTIAKAGIVTMGLLAGITATVFVTRANFSFLGPILAIGGFVALGFIVASMIFGFSLGLVFSLVMVAFAASSILYNTSNIMHEYHPSQHVAASLSLFASIALLFWYLLSIFSRRD